MLKFRFSKSGYKVSQKKIKNSSFFEQKEESQLKSKSVPALNFTLFLAGISIFCLVAGFIPVRAARSVTEKVPNPTKETLSPAFSAFSTLTKKASKAF